MLTPERLNQAWCVDFMSDVLVGGRRFRVLNVLDMLSREGLASEVDFSLPAQRVVEVFDQLALGRGYPERIVLDNGPEFQSQALNAWAYSHGVKLDFIAPGKPIQNAVMESFNGKMREECLNANWWRTVAEARDAIETFRQDHNRVRPHSALNYLTPLEFTARLTEGSKPQELASQTGAA